MGRSASRVAVVHSANLARLFLWGVIRAAKERTAVASAVISGQAAVRVSSRSRCRSVRFSGRVSNSRAVRRGERCGRSPRCRPWLRYRTRRFVAAVIAHGGSRPAARWFPHPVPVSRRARRWSRYGSPSTGRPGYVLTGDTGPSHGGNNPACAGTTRGDQVPDGDEPEQPVCAGTTTRRPMSSRSTREQPRVRGDDGLVGPLDGGHEGTAPRARGRRRLPIPRPGPEGNSPACAGTTADGW